MDSTLRSILDGMQNAEDAIQEQSAPVSGIPEGFCTGTHFYWDQNACKRCRAVLTLVECIHQLASLFCEGCQDAYCEYSRAFFLFREYARFASVLALCA
jgi:hypothetical protein